MIPPLREVGVEWIPSPNYGARRGGAIPQILVMHYTACPTGEALAILTSKAKEVSAHYLIPPEGGKVYSLVQENLRAHHAGKSQWRHIHEDVNSFSIGIENVGWGYTYGWVPPEPSFPVARFLWSSMIHVQRKIGEYLQAKKLFFAPQRKWHPFPREQIATLAVLAKNIVERRGIESENVVGHSDIAPFRKEDPGPAFPWEELAQEGIGCWFDRRTDRIHSDLPPGVSIPWMQESLQDWGYGWVRKTGVLDSETRKIVTAFQMHFRPERYDGMVDRESEEILDLLLCQRRNRED